MGRDIRGFKVQIAAPCTVEWASMAGTERVRFCGLCQKSVYELSGLTRAEVLALLDAKPDACVSFFVREDGTVLTADCPVGERLTRTARRLAWATRSQATIPHLRHLEVADFRRLGSHRTLRDTCCDRLGSIHHEVHLP